MMKKNNHFLITIFFLILILPSLDAIFNFSPVRDLFEKRTLSSKPELPSNAKELVNYPDKFESFYNDHFGFRKTLIFLNSQIMDKVFDQSPSNRAVFGKNGWLYFDNYNSLEDVRGGIFYDHKILENGVNALIKNWQELKQNNIDYVFVVAADKSTIYPEFLPNYIKPKFGNSRLDQFLALLKKEAANFPIIDLRNTSLTAKTLENKEIYYKTDTHWNKIGAYYGYKEIIDFLSINHPNLKPRLRKDFIVKGHMKKDGDIANIMNLKLGYDIEYDLIPKTSFNYLEVKVTKKEQERFHKPFFFVNKNKNLPILFSYKDSFSDNLMHFLPENFSKSYLINEFPCRINLKVIAEYKADIVIHQMWEGRIQDVFRGC
jgi:hypothetical protein